MKAKLLAYLALIKSLVATALVRGDTKSEKISEGFRLGMAQGSTDRAQGTNLVGLFIGLMIAAIVALQVMIPVVYDAINSSNLSGTEKTVAELIPLFAVLLLLIALASPLMRRI
jgi:hypothetical protein